MHSPAGPSACAAPSCWSARLRRSIWSASSCAIRSASSRPIWRSEIGLNAAEIGLLSSAFFFAFAAAQIPLGIALDRYGPKRCMLVCAAIALLGTLVFAIATTPAGWSRRAS